MRKLTLSQRFLRFRYKVFRWIVGADWPDIQATITLSNVANRHEVPIFTYGTANAVWPAELVDPNTPPV